MSLCRLLPRLDRNRFSSEVISLTGDSPLGERLRNSGIPVHSLGMQASRPSPFALARLATHLKRSKPAVIHSWMYHANLAASVSTRFTSDIPVVWSIHSSELPGTAEKSRTGLVNWLCARTSRRFADKVLFCSEESMRAHCTAGYPPNAACVIPNGFDTEEFAPNRDAGEKVRLELGIPRDATVIGLLGRFHPVKDHKTFLHAAADVCAARSSVQILLCGTGITRQNSELMAAVNELGLNGRVFLAGARNDMPGVMNTLDVLCLSSLSESFPLVVGEAMSCGIPVVSTDVGACRAIIGESGAIVPPRDAKSLAQALLNMVDLPQGVRRKLGVEGRLKIQTRFDLSSTARAHENLYGRVVARRFTKCAA